LVLPGAGLLVGLAATAAVLTLPQWLGLTPLWGRSRPPERKTDAVISLTGDGGLRPVPAGEPTWVDASHDALIHGDVRLRVSFATVGAAPLESAAGKQPPRDRCLVIGLRITNAGISRKITLNGWSNGVQERPVLRDEQGRAYAEKAFDPGWVVKGRLKTTSISPGKTVDDVLVFEPPPAGVERLRLELPGRPLGVEGVLRMEIPKQMIAYR
jgi:hypothetical protein